MPKVDQERIAEYYDRLVDRHGYDPRACDASGAKPLGVRYKVLSEVADLTGKSVLEAWDVDLVTWESICSTSIQGCDTWV